MKSQSHTQALRERYGKHFHCSSTSHSSSLNAKYDFPPQSMHYFFHFGAIFIMHFCVKNEWYNGTYPFFFFFFFVGTSVNVCCPAKVVFIGLCQFPWKTGSDKVLHDLDKTNTPNSVLWIENTVLKTAQEKELFSQPFVCLFLYKDKDKITNKYINL